MSVCISLYTPKGANQTGPQSQKIGCNFRDTSSRYRKIINGKFLLEKKIGNVILLNVLN
jgi:hypothetical protein